MQQWSCVISLYTLFFSIFGDPVYIHPYHQTTRTSKKIPIGTVSGRKSDYHIQGNGQRERYNGIIWKTVQLPRENQKLPMRHWEDVMREAVYAIRTLLCTKTNATPQERSLKFPKRSLARISISSSFSQPVTILLRNYARQSKYNFPVSKMELLEVKPLCAHSAPQLETVERFPQRFGSSWRVINQREGQLSSEAISLHSDSNDVKMPFDFSEGQSIDDNDDTEFNVRIVHSKREYTTTNKAFRIRAYLSMKDIKTMKWNTSGWLFT